MANEIRQDEQRQCPICRMVISAWATKCRYCGEEVGRPKREEAKVTIKDLGGESTSTYTLSGNVKDALEAFRAEQEMAMEAQRRQGSERDSWFHKKQEAPPNASAGQDSFSKLDARHKDLAQSVLGDIYTPRSTTPTRRSSIPEPIEKGLKIAGGAVAALLVIMVLIMGVGKVAAFMRADDTDAPAMMQNEALIMLSRGEPLIEAFGESVRVANFNNTNQDREIMEDIRKRLVEQINDLLAVDPYNENNQRKAANIVERAVLVDPSSTFRNLKVTVDAEGKAYSMVLKDFDEAGQWAEFTLHNDTYRDENGQSILQEKAGINGLIQKRFVVQKISRQEGVVLMDRFRNQRRIVFTRKGYDAEAYNGA